MYITDASLVPKFLKVIIPDFLKILGLPSFKLITDQCSPIV